jgi:hypothetical protein
VWGGGGGGGGAQKLLSKPSADSFAVGRRQKPVMKLFIFFTVLKTVKKSKKNSKEIIYFLHCFLFSSSFPTLYNLYLLFFTVF